MPSLAGLLKVGSMSESLGVYVPAIVLQKAIGLGRVWLLAYLMRESRSQYGLWGVALMLFMLAADLMGLGSKQGLVRYVSYYETRGLLGAFYRRMRWCVVALVVVTAAAAFACSGPIARYVIASREPAAGIDYHTQLVVCWLALANALVMAVYHAMVAFMMGMRTYRLVSVVEVMLGVVFTVLGVAALMVSRTATAILAAHLVSVVVVFVVGVCLLHRAVGRSSGQDKHAEPTGGEDSVRGAPLRVLRFGLAAMLAGLLWMGAQYVGVYLTNREFGKEAVAVFAVMFQFSQPILLIAGAAGTAIFTHVASRWEAGDRDGSVASLRTAYKAVAMATMTLTLILYAAAPLWIRLLPSEYQEGILLLGGLLLLFQAVIQLSVLQILAKLHERPIVIALAAAVAGGLAVVLARGWMDAWGPVGIAWGVGVGMYAGGGAVAVAYFRACRARLGRGTYVVLASPILLALPPWLAVALWAVLLALAIASSWLFTRPEKQLLLARLRGVFARA